MSEPKVLARYEEKISSDPDPERIKLYIHRVEKTLKNEWIRTTTGRNRHYGPEYNWYNVRTIWLWVRPNDSWAHPGDEASFLKAVAQLAHDCVLGKDRESPRSTYRYVSENEREEFREKKLRLDRRDEASEIITGLLARYGVKSHYNEHTQAVHPEGLENLEELAALLKKHLG